MDLIPLTPVAQIWYTTDTPLYRLMRYLLADTTSPSLDKSTLPGTSPITYAVDVVTQRWEPIFTQFALPQGIPETLPKVLKQAWVFTAVLDATLAYRIGHARPMREDDVLSLLYQVHAYTLLIHTPEISYGHYCGLFDLPTVVEFILRYVEGKVTEDDTGMVRALAAAVGPLHEPTSLLQTRAWLTVFERDSQYIRIARGFLFVAFKYLLQPNYLDHGVLNVTRHQVLRDIDTFIELRQDRRTTFRQVLEFLEEVEGYSCDIPSGQNERVVLCAQMEDFKRMHQAVFGDHFAFSKETLQKPSVDSADWILLRSLGDDSAPERTIQTMLTPEDYVTHVTQTYYASDYETVFVPFCRSRNIHIAPTKPSRNFWTLGAIEDAIYCSAVTRRYLTDPEIDYDTASQMMLNDAHLLLHLPSPEQERAGLSMVTGLIEFHLDHGEEITPEEQEIVNDFCIAWKKLRLDKPQKIPQPLRQLVKDKAIRAHLRNLAFFVIEAIQIPQEVVPTMYLGMPRDQAFSCIAQYAEHIDQMSEHEEDWRELLAKVPLVKAYYSIEELAFHMWTAPYPLIDSFMTDQEQHSDD